MQRQTVPLTKCDPILDASGDDEISDLSLWLDKLNPR